MTKVALLAVDENASIDMHRLEEIVSELGESAAAQVIGAALEQLALALTRTAEAAERAELATTTLAEQLARLAWQVGLVTLAGVAIDVGHCAERRDMAALAATTARLRRIGNQSLTRIWDDPEPE
ncbi:MAG: hypothetical protein QM682_01095 [Paracoccus sp. (in: a-proteobacteria)]|uniref:hypothetical protein n=1 Tax=Paracoccus sp. TaxID=267 RepID=UPI0039E4DE14